MKPDDICFLQDVEDVKHVFGDKWTIPVMVALAGGPLRRSEILATVTSYSLDENWPDKSPVLHDSILSRTLRKMVANRLVARHELPDAFPRHVRYELRPEALDFLERVRHVAGWSTDNAHVVTNAHDRHRLHHREPDTCAREACDLPASG